MIKWKLIAALSAITITSCGSAAQPIGPPTGATPPRLVSGAITNMDYPAVAIRAREQGNVRIELDISADGAVTNCAVITPSGSEALDTVTCAIARERFRFDPGRIADGTAAPSKYRQSVRWVLPNLDPQEERFPFAAFALATTASLQNGEIVACAGSGDGRSQPQPIEHCRRTFAGYPMWDSLRRAVASATSVTAFKPNGAAVLVARPEWGRMVLQLDTELAIGPDGMITGCEMIGPRGGVPCDRPAMEGLRFDRASQPTREGLLSNLLFVRDAPRQ